MQLISGGAELTSSIIVAYQRNSLQLEVLKILRMVNSMNSQLKEVISFKFSMLMGTTGFVHLMY